MPLSILDLLFRGLHWKMSYFIFPLLIVPRNFIQLTPPLIFFSCLRQAHGPYEIVSITYS